MSVPSPAPCPPRRLGLPAPPAGPGVCATCHGPAADGGTDCWCCRSMARRLSPGAVAAGRGPLVVPSAVFRVGDGMHRVLRGYKDAPAVAARRHFAASLRAHLARFVADHGPCLAAATGGWDAVAVVPSSGRGAGAAPRPSHPLDGVVGALPGFGDVFRIVLRRARGDVGHLVPHRQAFALEEGARGRRVLVVDDTWVTGARLHSAAAALADAGAEVVGALVAGRSVDVGARPATARWWSWLESGAAVPDRCCLPSCRSAVTP